MKRKLCFPSTVDNPYNPITEFGKWLKYDTLCHYNTLAYFGKLFDDEGIVSDPDYDAEVEKVCDEIVELCPLKNYKKVVEFVDVEENEVPDDYKPLPENIVRRPEGSEKSFDPPEGA